VTKKFREPSGILFGRFRDDLWNGLDKSFFALKTRGRNRGELIVSGVESGYNGGL